MTTSAGEEIGRVILREAARETVTPTGTMTTLASPTVGGTDGRSLWRVEMRAGACGPLHECDAELIWAVLEGDVQIEIGTEPLRLRAGDTAVIPAGALRQIRCIADSEAIVAGYASAIVAVPGEPAPRGTPEWMS